MPKLASWSAVLAVLMLSAGSGQASPPSPTTALEHRTDVAASAETAPGGNNDADRYCEIISTTASATGSITRVYPSYGINQCPASWWNAIDPAKVAAQLGAAQVLKNGPRYWVMDDLMSYQEVTEYIVVDGLNLGLVATVEFAGGSGAGPTPPYQPSRVNRHTRYSYFAGSLVHRLIDPQGQVYVMQSYSLQGDPNLTRDKLRALGDLLELPDGWTYDTVRLDQGLFLCANGLARVIQDDLGNSYQLVDGAPCVLSAYFGGAILPPGVNWRWCPGATNAGGFGGMPLALDQVVAVPEGGWYRDVQWALDPSDFQVVVGPHDEPVTPVCATLQPAVDAGERKTILLAGEFGTGGHNMPVSIRIVGDVRTVEGSSLQGIEIVSIFPLDAGSHLTWAEVFDSADAADCPRPETSRALKITFSGGVTGPDGVALAGNRNALDAIQVMGMDADGARAVLQPIALGDDDNDNYLDVCLGGDLDGLALRTLSVNSHTFYSPMNAPNQAAAVRILAP